MSTIITMTATVGTLTNGQTYRVRSKTAELLIAQSKASRANTKRATASNEGKA